MKTYLQEVERKTKKLGDVKKGKFAQKFLNTKLTCLGLSLPQIRGLEKNGYSFRDQEDLDKVWNHIFLHSRYFDVMSQALIYFQKKKKKIGLSEWKILKKWVARIDNWEHSDRMSDLIAELHERHPKTIYPELKKWNSSKKPWYRRQSIVGLFLYSASRKKQPAFSKVLPLVDNLLFDDHFYVQKGVGWTLRELYNVYPKKTYAYLLAHAHEIAPAGWQAATEKLSKKQKDKLKLRRKTKKIRQ